MELLLRTWRGDKDIDWPAIERDLMPCKLCPTCARIKLKSSFTETEFKRLDDNNQKVGICKLCQAIQKEKQLPLQCTSCFTWRAETDYPPKERHWSWSSKRVCKWCNPKKTCSMCKVLLERKHFSDGEWLRMRKHTLDGKCIDCASQSKKKVVPMEHLHVGCVGTRKYIRNLPCRGCSFRQTPTRKNVMHVTLA